MKYIAILSIDEPSRWGEWHCGSTAWTKKSDLLNTKEEAEDFIKLKLQEWKKFYEVEDIDIFFGEWKDYIKQEPEPPYIGDKVILAIDEENSINLDWFIDCHIR